ncbi:MAG: ATP-binding protein [Candidatus Parvarchaeota archaeon]|nr:ATP-binding protein [Candidatus Jingweiarchaeum tengchongense]
MNLLKIPINRTTTILIIGKKNSGKTTLAKYLVKSLNYDFLIIDIIGNWKEFKQQYDYLLVDPSIPDPRIWKYAMRYGKFVIIDEADRHKFDWELEHFYNISRNFGCGWLAIARRMKDLPPIVRTNSDFTFIGKTYHETDFKPILEDYYISENEIRNLKDFEFLVFKDNEFIGKTQLILS